MRRVTRKAYELDSPPRSQDGSCQFITLLACVSALGNTIPPTFLCKRQFVWDLQNSGVNESRDEDKSILRYY